MQLETVLSPSLFHQIEDIAAKNVVVIDILRATSTITTILANGADAVIPVMKQAEAEEYQKQGLLVGGERGGETIPGFDFGNSPFQYKPELVKNKEVVLTTTNGTKCITMAKDGAAVYLGSFLSLDALVKKLLEDGRDTVLFCAGWKDRVNLEDSLFAGAVAALLPEAQMDDASQFARYAWEQTEDLFETLKASNHFQRLAIKGVVKDIEYCCRLNLFDIVPSLLEGKLTA
jgi:2-phosphosulfolactate phosphatase